VNAFLFRPLPVPNADRLAVVAVQSGAQSIPAELSYRDYVDYRQQSDAFTDLAAYAINVTGLGTKGHADRIIASYVTSNYFSTLGVQPAVGRFFAAGEGDQPNSSPVVKILGWINLSGLMDKSQLADPDAVLNGIAYDAKGDRLFVTGKLWPKLFEIRVVQQGHQPSGTAAKSNAHLAH
jgi:hypothetical protein